MKDDSVWKNRVVLASIIAVILLIIVLVLISSISVEYECTILFSGSTPYVWGKTPSIAMESVIRPFYIWYGLLLVSLLLITWHMNRKNDAKADKPIYYLLCAAIATVPIIKLFSVAAKYDTALYDVNEAVVNSNGESVNLLELTRVPVILSFVVLIILIICAIMINKENRKKTKE